MTTATKTQQEEAREHLRERIQPGDTLYTIIRHVSRSGMMRAIDVYELKHDDHLGRAIPHWLSSYACKAAGFSFNRKHNAVTMNGAGMDMGFELVYNLGWALFPDGFDCAGERCPSNDHSNGDTDYAPHPHKDGGYALRQEWM